MSVSRANFIKGTAATIVASSILFSGIGSATAAEVHQTLPGVSVAGVVPNAQSATSAFTDVANDPFKAEIGWMKDKGLANGWAQLDGTAKFNPEWDVQRAAQVAFLYRLSGSPEVELPEHSPFIDVDESNPFYKEIIWAFQNDIVTGWQYDDGSRAFKPWQPVERNATAAWFYRLAGSPEFQAPATPSFRDVHPSHPFYKEIEWMKANKITTGWPDGTFRPNEHTHRNAVAAFVYRYNVAVLGYGS